MYFQNLVAFSVALLAGTSIATEINGGEIPSNLRKGRSKLRAADLLSGSSSAKVITVTPIAAATPSPSTAADASKVMVSMSSVAMPSSSAAASSKHAAATKFQSSARPSSSVAASSSAAHRPAQGTHAAQKPAIGPSTADDHGVTVPVQELSNQADAAADKDADKPFWSRPVSDTKPRPNAPDFSEAPETRVDDKDSCSLRCQDLANQCAELLPNDNDFCWESYPSCQDRCIKEHVH